MNSRITTFILLLIVSALIVLSGCGANNETSNETNKSDKSNAITSVQDLAGHTYIYNNGDLKTTLDFYPDDENGETKVTWEWSADNKVFEGILDEDNSMILWDDGAESSLEVVNGKLLLKEKADTGEEFKYILTLKE